MHLATAPDASELVSTWQRRAIGRDGPAWVVAGAALQEALDCEALVVAPPPFPVLADTARFSEGADHVRRRAAAIAALPSATGLREAAYAATAAALLDDGRVDVVPIALAVPVHVLAAALGCPELAAPIAALGSEPSDPRLQVDPVLTGLLFQCRDATAALIAGLLTGEPANVLGVVLTRRRADVAVTLAGAEIPAGSEVRLLLGDRSFGGGRHACPGREVATALAKGVVAAVLSRRRVTGIEAYLPSPNLRLPRAVWTEPA